MIKTECEICGKEITLTQKNWETVCEKCNGLFYNKEDIFLKTDVDDEDIYDKEDK
jgi:ribosome-binding protein aMBF1 (putative translation factor)